MRAKQVVSLVIGIVYIGIAIFLASDLLAVSKSLISKLGLGWVNATIIARALVCLSFARGLQLVVKSFTNRIHVAISFAVGLVLGFGVSFLSPIYQSDYGDFATQDLSIDHQGLTDITNGAYQIKNKPYVVAFFTTSCPHCKYASQQLGFLNELDKMPPIIAIFPGNDSDTKKFLAENNGLSFEHYRLDEDEKYFLDNSGAAFPSVFLINEKGETMKHWFGDLLNYSALDYLETVKQ